MANSFTNREVVVDPDGNVPGSAPTIEAALAIVAGERSRLQQTTTAQKNAAPWTIRLIAGLYERDSQLDLRNLVGIKLIGAGKEATKIIASTAFLTLFNGGGGTADNQALIHMGGTDHVTLENLSVDARINDSSSLGISAGNFISAVYCPDAVKATFVNGFFAGIRYGIWEDDDVVFGSADVFNCSCLATNAAIGSGAAIWHIFSSDLIGRLEVGKTSVIGGGYTCGWASTVTGAEYNTTFWACHLHGESEAGTAPASMGGIAFASGTSSGKVIAVGSTLHVKSLQAVSNGVGGHGAFRLSGSPLTTRFILVGCDLLLETGTGFTTGSYGCIQFNNNTAGVIDLIGCSLWDCGGSSTGTSKRGLIVQNTGTSTGIAITNKASNFVNGGIGFLSAPSATFMTGGPLVRGSVTLAAGTAVVRLLPAGTNKGGAAATSFTNGNTTVTGSGTAFLTDFRIGDYIKAASHADSAWTQITNITSDTSLTLITGGYRGATLATTQAQGSSVDATTQPTADYGVVLTPQAATGAGETFHVTGKHASGFTVNSSSGASTLTLDYVLSR